MLDAIVVKHPLPQKQRSKHLCANAGYKGKAAMGIILAHGYIPHTVGRMTETDQKKRSPRKKARRRVVEACHGWSNLLATLHSRYQKLLRGLATRSLCLICIVPAWHFGCTLELVQHESASGY